MFQTCACGPWHQHLDFLLLSLLLLCALCTAGYDNKGYDKYGYDRTGYNTYGYDNKAYDKYGYSKDGELRCGLSSAAVNCVLLLYCLSSSACSACILRRDRQGTCTNKMTRDYCNHNPVSCGA